MAGEFREVDIDKVTPGVMEDILSGSDPVMFCENGDATGLLVPAHYVIETLPDGTEVRAIDVFGPGRA